MAGNYYTLGDVPSQQNRVAVLVLCACASAAALLFANASSTQNWTTPATRVATPVYSTPLNKATGFRATPLAVHSVEQLTSSSSTQPDMYTSDRSLSAPMVAAAAVLFTGAAALARKLLITSAPVALMSTTSETKDDSKEKMRKMVEKLDSSDMRLLARGGSMEEVVRSKGIDEVAAAIRADQISRKDLTPKDVILELQRGNGRFWMGLSERPDMSAMERRALIMAQAPKVAILSCSDSRVPVEVIFDQGLGEVFVVRMAGNILNDNAEGSMEFAVKYLGVKVVMVIGHEGCGAVKGAITMSSEDISKEPKDLQTVLNSIKSKLDVGELNTITDSRSRDREAIVLNTSNQVKLLQQNKLLAERVADGSLLVCGAFYEISSGIVDLFSLDKSGFVIDM